jgi:hypothetical protein
MRFREDFLQDKIDRFVLTRGCLQPMSIHAHDLGTLSRRSKLCEPVDNSMAWFMHYETILSDTIGTVPAAVSLQLSGTVYNMRDQAKA